MEEFEIEFKELDQFEIEDVREVVVQEVPTFPALENLVVTPTTEEQVFNHENSYGYDEVRVEAVQGKSLEVTPSNEEQSFSDLYTNVKVLGDEDLVASNIKQGVEIFGVTGSLEEMTIEVKEGINNQEEIITNQETTLEEINQVIQDKILVKEKYKPRYFNNYQLFKGYTGTELDQETQMLDTTYFTDMNNMFYDCKNITRLDLNGWNTSNVTNMNQMFQNCSSLKELKIEKIDTSNVTSMNSMFYGLNIPKLDLRNLNTSNVTSMSSMFFYSSGLTELDLSTWDTSKTTNMSSMFYLCQKLKKIDMRSFTFGNVTSYSTMFEFVPADCLIIVKGGTEKQWVLNARSTLTNVKTIAELEG